MTDNQKFKLTYATMFNPPEEMHQRYEAALAEVKAALGREHAMIINGEDRKAGEKFEDKSPINTEWVLGVFQQGDARDAADAVAAAKPHSLPGAAAHTRSGWRCCAKPRT